MKDRYGDGDEDDYADGTMPCDLGSGPGCGWRTCCCRGYQTADMMGEQVSMDSERKDGYVGGR